MVKRLFSLSKPLAILRYRRIWWMISLLLMILSGVAMITQGIPFGTEFTGGEENIIRFQQPVHLEAVASMLKTWQPVVVRQFEDDHQLMITAAHHDVQGVDLKTVLQKQKATASFQFISSRMVGSEVSQELGSQSLLALLVSFCGIGLYLAWRFEKRFAIAAILALIHDPILVCGIFAWQQITFDLPALAGLLAVIGYSLNDTVVVYDRARELFQRYPQKNPLDVMNMSIVQTFSRTLVTSGVTMLVVLALLIWGGDILRGFSMALVVGIIVGTYSSIFIAGAIAVALGAKSSSFQPKPKKFGDPSRGVV